MATTLQEIRKSLNEAEISAGIVQETLMESDVCPTAPVMVIIGAP